MTYDERAAAAALRILRPKSQGGKGQRVYLVRVETGEYDVNTQSAEQEEVTYESTGLLVGIKQRDIDGTVIKQGDQMLLMPPQGIPQPTTSDRILIGCTKYSVEDVEAVEPAGVPALYILRVRGVGGAV